jgi:hypothetical protein
MRGRQLRVERWVTPNSRHSRSSSLGHSVIARHGIARNGKATAGSCPPITDHDTGASDKSLALFTDVTKA